MFTNGQAAAGTAVTTLCVMPPGPATLQVVNPGTVTVYLGTGSKVATNNGYPVPASGTFTIPGYAGGGGATVSMCTAAGSASVAWFVSGASGQTGL